MADYVVKCPQCARELTVPAGAAGRKGQCPRCALVFTLGPPPAEEAQPQIEIPDDLFADSKPTDRTGSAEVVVLPLAESASDTTSESWAGTATLSKSAPPAMFTPTHPGRAAVLYAERTDFDDPGWPTVSTGLKLIQISILLWAGAVGGLLAAGFSGPLAGLIGIGAVLAMLGGTALWTIGSWMCCAAPDRRGAKWFALAGAIATSLTIAAPALMLFAFVSRSTELASLAVTIINIVSYGVAEAGLLSFLLFLRAVAVIMDDDDLRSGAVRYMLVAGAIFGVSVLIQLLGQGDGVMQVVGRVLGCLFLVAMLGGVVVMIVWLYRLVRHACEITAAIETVTRVEYAFPTEEER